MALKAMLWFRFIGMSVMYHTVLIASVFCELYVYVYDLFVVSFV